MTRRLPILAVVPFILLLSVVMWVCVWPVAPRPSASVVLLGVTSNAFGEQVAILCLTNPTATGVTGIPHSIDHKTGDHWVTQPSVPGAVIADMAASADLSPHEGRVISVRFPTSGSWKLRVRYHEQPRGAAGLLDRLTDLFATLRDRARHTSYTGQSYLAETVEIGQ